MTDQQHQITPPLELFKQWEDDILNERDNVDHVLDCAWRSGFQAGADQELEACCEWLETYVQHWAEWSADFCAARRPKPPSLKEQAKFAAAVLRSPDETCSIAELQQHWHTICNALEQLND